MLILDDINHEKFGQSIISQFKNAINSTFCKDKRPGMEDKSKVNFPGFKYKRFSEFGEEG
jgi:cyanate lyase